VGSVAGHTVSITSRGKFLKKHPGQAAVLPDTSGGLECVVVVDWEYAATYRFRDTPRAEGGAFVRHLRPRHKVNRVMLVSGDRESEVRYLGDQVGIGEIYAAQSPENKLEIVCRETSNTPTLFLGDGINDAPALTAATVGIAIGQNSDVTSEAADVVVMDSSLDKVDELFHIGRRMRRFALQSALGGMALSLVGMGFAAFGLLVPIAGAITQEVIDALAILNALRAAFKGRTLSDF
jgi:P-type E1-E2 ATPase